MDINALLTDKIKRFEDLKQQIMSINNQIGALQEQGRAIHMTALEVKGAIEAFVALKQSQEEAAKKSETAKLILPEGVKPVVEAPAAATPATPVALEVK